MLIGILVFVGVAALVGGAILLLRDKPSNKIEDRLDLLTGTGAPTTKDGAKEASILSQPLDDRPGLIQTFVERFGNIELLFEQADVNLGISKLLAISLALAVVGAAMGGVVGIHPALIPLAGLLL